MFFLLQDRLNSQAGSHGTALTVEEIVHPERGRAA